MRGSPADPAAGSGGSNPDHTEARDERAKTTDDLAPVERLARGLSVQLRFSPLEQELSGTVCVKDGTPIIGVNAIHHPNRQRFTTVHECGHLVLHRDRITQEVHVDKAFPTLMRDAMSAAGADEMECEANLFA